MERLFKRKTKANIFASNSNKMDTSGFSKDLFRDWRQDQMFTLPRDKIKQFWSLTRVNPEVVYLYVSNLLKSLHHFMNKKSSKNITQTKLVTSSLFTFIYFSEEFDFGFETYASENLRKLYGNINKELNNELGKAPTPEGSLNNLANIFFSRKDDFPEQMDQLDALLVVLCYIPVSSKHPGFRGGGENNAEAAVSRDIDHFNHFKNNLYFLEEDDIPETGEYCFIWLKMEKFYQMSFDMERFASVSIRFEKNPLFPFLFNF